MMDRRRREKNLALFLNIGAEEEELLHGGAYTPPVPPRSRYPQCRLWRTVCQSKEIFLKNLQLLRGETRAQENRRMEQHRGSAA